MKYLENFKHFDKNIFGYHITQRRKLKSIMKKGLIPKIPVDFGNSGDLNGVYLFKTKSDAENGLQNWFGERIEEWEEEHTKEFDEICLTIDLTGLEQYLLDSVEYEWTCITIIDPSRIISVNECTSEFFNKLFD